MDGQKKQELPVKGCQGLINVCQENINHVLINSKESIYLLESINIEKQIDQLLNTYRLQEALTLAENHSLSTENNEKSALLISTKKRVGLVEFNAMNTIRALHLFDQIDLDYHEIMTEIPNFLPLNSPWPELNQSNKFQYVQWLNGFCDYMTQRSIEFSRQSVCTKKVSIEVLFNFIPI